MRDTKAVFLVVLSLLVGVIASPALTGCGDPLEEYKERYYLCDGEGYTECFDGCSNSFEEIADKEACWQS